MSEKLRVALVGLGFGGGFAPIWRDHPDVEEVVLCDTNKEVLEQNAKEYGIERTCSTLDEVLDTDVNCVHLVTPIPLHAEQTVKVLMSGRHCACTVPMATSLEDIEKIAEAARVSGKNYMMMETTLYTYQYFYIKELLEKGEIGDIQLLRGSHYQDMEGWPNYWMGLPPFWYGTHAIAPMVGLSGSRIERVACLGSGKMRKELTRQYNNPFPAETMLIRFENGLAGEATRTLFETARAYQEGLFVYGSKKSVEWGFTDGADPIVTELIDNPDPGSRGKHIRMETVEMPNFYKYLPEPLWQYTVGAQYYDATNPQKSLQRGAGAGHHGSHAHLVNEFARSIIEKRKPFVDVSMAANITAAGICAHISALNGGEWIKVPEVR